MEIITTLPNDDLTEAIIPYLNSTGIQIYETIVKDVIDDFDEWLEEDEPLPEFVGGVISGFKGMKGVLKLLFT